MIIAVAVELSGDGSLLIFAPDCDKLAIEVDQAKVAYRTARE